MTLEINRAAYTFEVWITDAGFVANEARYDENGAMRHYCRVIDEIEYIRLAALPGVAIVDLTKTEETQS